MSAKVEAKVAIYLISFLLEMTINIADEIFMPLGLVAVLKPFWVPKSATQLHRNGPRKPVYLKIELLNFYSSIIL